MKRCRLFNALAGISLVLCVMTAVMWVSSRDWGHSAQGLEHGTQIHSELYVVGWQPGYVLLWRVGPIPFIETPVADDGLFGWDHSTEYFGLHISSWSHTNLDSVTSSWILLCVPFWWLFIITSFLPTCWAIRTLRWRRRRPCGLCPTCGYDLRATPGRCPECGAIPKKLGSV